MSLKARHSLLEYRFGELLGRGTYGTVYKGFKKGSKPEETVAIKCVQKNSLSKESIDGIVNEISITKRVKNQFIVELKDFKWIESHIYLIFEFCCGGDLAQLIRQRKCFSEPIVRHFLQQIATALKTLRSHSIAHMDLKPQNILISSKICGNQWRNVVLKIADFGFAQYLRPEDSATSLRGSPLYMAPEILLRTKYDASVDLWSVGIILYECLFGSAPFSSESIEELTQKIKSPEPIKIPTNIDISDNCRDILAKLLQRDPRKRISFDEFFGHPFIDLEHMPSSESYTKGVQLIREAVDNDLKGHYNESFKLYTEGLQYLVPVYKWGDGSTVWDQNTAKALETKLTQYMERAEELKNNCRLIAVDPKDLQSIQTAYQLIEKAEQLVKIKSFRKAFVEYNNAIEMGFEVMPRLKVNDKTILYEELNKWITRAELVKSRFKTSDNKNANNRQSLEAIDKRRNLSYNNFVTKTCNSRDLSVSPTCYVQ